MQSNQVLSEMKEVLLSKRQALEERLDKIQSSKKRDEPLDADSGERSLELENNEVVDALDAMEVKDLRLINAALEKIEGGGYGLCASCGESISLARLKALPFAPVCLECAQAENAQGV